ncbi:MAG: prephenate dehydratase [Acidobacteriia bacterium]|nr:prephenate dehydratase [Terriglobia bacterium]
MKIRVAFQGERGAFSEQAARQLMGTRIEVIPCETFEKTFACVGRGRADLCIVPVENTLAGSITRNLDLSLKHRFNIVGETNLRIEHHLVALRGTTWREINRIISHPVALEQCQKFLRRHPHIKSEVAYDTAGSVKMIVEHGWHDTAAIAGAWAAQWFRCGILQKNIEDHHENYTRFWLLEKGAAKRRSGGGSPWSGRKGNKSSIVFSTKNVPGALFKCLSVFALRDIDLTKIESRPVIGRPFEYFFYVDFLGNVAEERCQNALRHLGEVTDFLRVLGCYPRG